MFRNNQQLILLFIFVGIPLLRWIAGEVKKQNTLRGQKNQAKAQRSEAQRTGRTERVPPAQRETAVRRDQARLQQQSSNDMQALMLKRQEQLRRLRDEQLRKLREQQAGLRARKIAQRTTGSPGAAGGAGATSKRGRATTPTPISRQATAQQPTPTRGASRTRAQQRSTSSQTMPRASSRSQQRPTRASVSAKKPQKQQRTKQRSAPRSASRPSTKSSSSGPLLTRSDMTRHAWRKAIIMSELLAPPVSMRDM